MLTIHRSTSLALAWDDGAEPDAWQAVLQRGVGDEAAHPAALGATVAARLREDRPSRDLLPARRVDGAAGRRARGTWDAEGAFVVEHPLADVAWAVRRLPSFSAPGSIMQTSAWRCECVRRST